MPHVLTLGVSYDEFWSLNPHKINILIKAFNEKKKQDTAMQNMFFHLQGQYFADALLATVGNMFRGKGQKAFYYPKEPYTLNLDYEKGLDMDDAEQREIAMRRRNFVTNLNNLFRDIDRNLQESNDGY